VINALSNRLREDVLLRMNDTLSAEQLNHLSIVLDVVLVEYNIEKKSTELSIRDNSNDIILKNFLGDKLLQGKSKSTIKQYQPIIQKLLDGVGKPVHKITSDDIRAYLARYQLENNISAVSLKNRRNYFMSFFNWCLNNDVIEKNPMRQIPAFKVPKKQIKPITETEMELMRSVCTCDRDRALIDFLYSTGCRVSECAAFNITDIDFDNYKAIVRNGKGNKERKVYISAKCMVWLKKYLGSREDNNNALWIGKKGRLTKSGIENIIRYLGQRANLEGVHPHQFRHALATDMVSKNVSVPIVQQILGHEDISTTTIYMSINDNDVENAHRKYVV